MWGIEKFLNLPSLPEQCQQLDNKNGKLQQIDEMSIHGTIYTCILTFSFTFAFFELLF